MFLQLNHQKLDIYNVAMSFVGECYKFSKILPPQERFNLVQQKRRAAISVHLNIAEGASRKSEIERRRFYEIARGSLIEIDAALDVAVALNYSSKEAMTELGMLMMRCFSMLSKLINTVKIHD
jgi:four helix bundle protein